MDKKVKDNRPFSERHPKLNLVIGVILILILASLAGFVIFEILSYLGAGISKLISLVSKLDAVVIVALITGSVSITGVIISSIVSKIIDYKKNRQEYLTQKREKPYGEFVDMIYKIQQNANNPDSSYMEQEMLDDLLKFSKEITLWGSKRVVNKWVQFRKNGSNPNAAIDNLFVMENIMNEMRKDLGLKKAKEGRLLSFFINDIEPSMKAMKNDDTRK